MSGTEYDEVQMAAAQMQMSETMQKVAMTAKDMPFDMQDTEELKSCLGACVFEMATAIDEGRMIFLCDDAKALTFGILAIGFSVITDGKIELEEVKTQ